MSAERPALPPEPDDLTVKYQIALDALVRIRNLDRSTWTSEAVEAHAALVRLGWRP